MHEAPSCGEESCSPVTGATTPPNSDPMIRASNYLVAGASFARKFGRWPLPADDPAATVNDLVFNRMIDPQWSSYERSFVDKETAKLQAQHLFPGLRVPETLLVISMEDVASIDHLYDRLQPFAGTDVIAKPTHASGVATFMRDVRSSADLHPLYLAASIDYSCVMREMQYWRLPRKIIVETMVRTSNAASPDDYKFHCVNGQPLVYQVDHNRFGAPWSRLFRVPGSEPMHEGDGLRSPATFAKATPDRLATMMSAAQVLAAPFKHVRVDFYDGLDGVFFGEMTFTPAASLGIAPSSMGDHPDSPTHQVYSRIIMDASTKQQKPSKATEILPETGLAGVLTPD